MNDHSSSGGLENSVSLVKTKNPPSSIMGIFRNQLITLRKGRATG